MLFCAIALGSVAPAAAATSTRTPTATPTTPPTRTPPPTFAFGPRSAYPVDGVTGLAVGDYNGDGKPDIVAVGLNADAASDVSIWYSQSDGSFRPQLHAVTIQGFPEGIAAGQLVNLGATDKLDDFALLFQDFFGNEGVQVFANLGGSLQQVTFQPRGGMLPVGEVPAGVTVLDLSGNGTDNSLAVPNSGDGTVSLFFRVGANFIAQPVLPTGRDPSLGVSLPFAVAAGPLGNDPLPDLAVALNQDFGVAVHTNTGTAVNPTFAPPVVYDPDQNSSNDIGPTGVVVADFNGDGHPDIAMSNQGSPGSSNSGSVSIHINRGDGTFQNAVAYPVGNSSVDGLAAADFNGDGFADLITRNGDDTLSVLLGRGDGTFGIAPNLASIPVGKGLAGMVVADFNQDGKLDVAVAEGIDGTISVLLGGGAAPPPTLSPTPTTTATPSQTPSFSRTPTATRTPTVTPTAPPTGTATPTSKATTAATPVPTVTATPTRTASAGIPGDADCDQRVTPADLAALATRLFDPSFHPECNGADANGDQDVTAADFSETIRLIEP